MSQYKTDDITTVQELRKRMDDFVDARNWDTVSTPKNLAMSIAIEAAELMEHFQWGENSDYVGDKVTPEKREEIAMEVADVMVYLVSFCRALDIDLSTAVMKKMDKNELRFPVENYVKK